jgi:acetyl esterase
MKFSTVCVCSIYSYILLTFRTFAPVHPSVYRLRKSFTASFEYASNDPDDSALDPETRSWMARFVDPKFRSIEIDAIKQAISGNSSALNRIRGRAPRLPVPQSVLWTDLSFQGPKGNFTVRHYRPAAREAAASVVIVHIHGGGWVGGSLERGNFVCGELVDWLSAEVLAVDYSRSPEAAPGVALDDCQIVWNSIPASRVVFFLGDSAGGNLAAGLIFKVLQEDPGARLPDGVILFYPVTDLVNLSYASYKRFERGYGLEFAIMRELIRAYVPDEGNRSQPVYSPINGNVSLFPPALVVTAQFDLLRDEGTAFAEKLRRAGRSVRYRCIEGTTHGFISKPDLKKIANQTKPEVQNFVNLLRTREMSDS